jgi:hypothetical protein
MKCRKEELSFIAEYALANFIRDKADFVDYSSEYEDALEKKYNPQVKLVKEAVATSKVVAEQKTLTKRIKNDYKSARNWANKVEDYANKASKSLKTSVADFGFKALRQDINIKNDEGTILKFRELLQHTDTEIPALQAKGFTPALRLSLGTFIDGFETDIKSQTYKIDERKDLVKVNNNVFTDLGNMINDDILKTGKIIYKEKDKAKVKDYTFSELLSKIRVARKKEEETKKTETKADDAATKE